MAGQPGKPGAAGGERQRRLAEALRANLRKRKQGSALEPAEGPSRGGQDKSSLPPGENLS